MIDNNNLIQMDWPMQTLLMLSHYKILVHIYLF